MMPDERDYLNQRIENMIANREKSTEVVELTSELNQILSEVVITSEFRRLLLKALIIACNIGVVYFIQSVKGKGYIKIGFSNNPKRRLREIQRYSPIELRIIAMIKGGREKEAELHRRFSKYRRYGEWFEPSQEILQFIINSTENVEGL